MIHKKFSFNNLYYHKNISILYLIVCLFFISCLAECLWAKDNSAIVSYSSLMKRYNCFIQGKKQDGTSVLSSEKQKIQNKLIFDFAAFIESEKKKLIQLNISSAKIEVYLNQLNKQLEILKSISRKRMRNNNSFLNEVKISNKPGGFFFNNEPVKIKTFQNQSPSRLRKRSLRSIPSSYLPTFEDVNEDGEEIIINSEIKELAESLNKNPVQIFNYVRNNIAYEPYYGAKKGNIGCLREKTGNDVDISSLTISLLRAAGIPARYKKMVAVVNIERLKQLLGVESAKTVYAAFFWNDVPVYTLDGSNIGEDFKTADFSGINELALEWVFVEAFYEYDERGANIDNTLELYSIESTEGLQELLSQYPKKQWIPVDSAMKPYVHEKKEIVPASSGLNTQDFWYDYFQYNGSLSPIDKYASDIESLTGKNIKDESYQSSIKPDQKKFQILPYKFPYKLGSGVSEDGDEILQEVWSKLPDSRRYQVKISLVKKSDNSVILEHSFYGSKVNNQGIELLYEGTTDSDKQTILNYGGIHATPASLVNISPYFYINKEKISSTIPIQIGESCLLTFDYLLNNETIHSNDKFSTAGNNEGIFVVLSNLQENHFFDNDDDPNIKAKILLDGNIQLARQFIRRNLAQMNMLKRCFDLSANVSFFRAVVTQNRILSEIDGVPTTFSFKGLSIDAVSHIHDYSNREEFSLFRKDFHLLWGLAASYDEANIFKDIAGLDAISTVKGLQYAYSHPSDYNIHIITSANESIINSLLLSENTKQNMHNDIQDGCTIITPHKFVNEGDWYGLFYVSLKDDGTGTYAIGEQVQQNGGWTITYILEENGIYMADLNGEYYQYYDHVSGRSINSRISAETLSEVSIDNDWNANDFGYPIFEDSKIFGGVEHKYILATKGAKFIGSNYNYWISENNVKNILLEDKDKDNNFNLFNIRLNGAFQFDLIAATYSLMGKYNFNSSLTAFYQPSNDKRGHGRIVYGKILSKLYDYSYETILCNLNDNNCYKQLWVLNKLGFPIENRKIAQESISGTKGDYQSFIGGQVYINKRYFDETFYVPNEIATFYNSDQNCRFINQKNSICGSGGLYGFPVDDPILIDGEFLKQVFEEAVIEYDRFTKLIQEKKLSMEARRHGNKLFAINIREQQVNKGKITDVEAFEIISNEVARKNNNKEDFVRDLTVLLTEYSNGEITYLRAIRSIINKKKTYTPHEYEVQWFSDTGFKFLYNDGHYCTEFNKDLKIYVCESNQLRHSIAGFNLAFFKGKEKADYLSKKYDSDISPFNMGGDSFEDIELGLVMSKLGDELSNNKITKEKVGERIINNLAVENVRNMRISYDDIISMSEFRKKFRVYEYQKNGSYTLEFETYAENLLCYYKTDMKSLTCKNDNEEDVIYYYQDYNRFKVDGELYSPAKAILNNDENKMILLYGEILDKYQDKNGKILEDKICSNFEYLSNEYGEALNMTFKEMMNELN